MESLPSGRHLPPSSRCLDQDFLLQPRALGSWALSQAAKASIFKSVPWRSGPRGLPWFLQRWGTGVWADVQRLRPSSQPLSTEDHQPPLEAPGTQPRALPRATACLLFCAHSCLWAKVERRGCAEVGPSPSAPGMPGRRRVPGAAVGRAEVGPTGPQARPDYGLPRLGSWGAGLLPNSEARHHQHLINLKGRHESGCGYPGVGSLRT